MGSSHQPRQRPPPHRVQEDYLVERLDLGYREVALQEKATIKFTNRSCSNSETASPLEGWVVEVQGPESGVRTVAVPG